MLLRGMFVFTVILPSHLISLYLIQVIDYFVYSMNNLSCITMKCLHLFRSPLCQGNSLGAIFCDLLIVIFYLATIDIV